MKRIVKVRLYPNKEEKQILRELQLRCSYLYNRVNYILRQRYFSFGRVKVSDGVLYKLAKDLHEYKQLPSDIAQEILKKLSEDWKSFLSLKKLEKNEELPKHIKRVSPPKYKEDRKGNKAISINIYIKTGRSYRLGDYSFELTVPKDLNNKRLRVRAKYSIPYENIKSFGRAEIFFRAGEWWCYATANIQQQERQAIGENLAGIDFGIRNFLTIAVETSKGLKVFQFKSREPIKDYKRRNRKIAKYQSILNKSGAKISKRLQKLYAKRDRRLKQPINAILNIVVSICISEGVKTVFVGELTGIREDKDFGKLNILLHNFWIRDYTFKRLKEKLLEAGIGIEPIPEHYTSSRCFKYGSPVKRPINTM